MCNSWVWKLRCNLLISPVKLFWIKEIVSASFQCRNYFVCFKRLKIFSSMCSLVWISKFLFETNPFLIWPVPVNTSNSHFLNNFSELVTKVGHYILVHMGDLCHVFSFFFFKTKLQVMNFDINPVRDDKYVFVFKICHFLSGTLLVNISFEILFFQCTFDPKQHIQFQ